MTTATTTAFGRVSNTNSAKVNTEIILANKALWDSQNVDNKELVALLESQGRDSMGNIRQKGFMGSLLKYISSYGYLSVPQTESLRKIMNQSPRKEIVVNEKSKHISKKGETVNLEVRLDSKIKKYLDTPAFVGDSMVRHYFLMADKAGNRIVYSGTSSRMSSMEEGKIYSMEVEIKDHYERNGEKQTYVFAAKSTPKKLTKFSVKRTRKTSTKK